MAKSAVDVFFPYLKKSKRKGWIGVAHRTLNRIGPTWLTSPLRRVVQVVCLALFLYAFFYVCWPYSSSSEFSAGLFDSKELNPAELFLLIDPLVGVSTALAGKVFNWATFAWTLGILTFCILIPRAFCGWFCPLGTLIDFFDWAVGKRVPKLHVEPRGWWVHTKYYILTGVLVSALFGVMTAGFFSAIPVLTRGLLFTGGRAQIAVLKDSSHLRAVEVTFYISIAMFCGVFLLSLMGKRFWCRYVCPSGALLSVFNTFRVGERKVESSCVKCNKCVEICPFDAIKEDFTTRTADCTYCQTCGGVCPVHSIKFVTRFNDDELKVENDPPNVERPMSRRGFVAATVVAGAAAAFARVSSAKAATAPPGEGPLRPPGSVPEPDFLNLCIRCGECFKVCPGPVLHPAGLEFGLDAMWTPIAVPSHAGCHQDCNFCTEVCPTGAIQPLDLLVKRKTHMGLAWLNPDTCLPLREENREPCDLCYVECAAAGYDAITLETIRIELDPPPPDGMFSVDELDAMSRVEIPVVDRDLCVGCGICEYRCNERYVKQTGVLSEPAIVVTAENEHRLFEYPESPSELPMPNTRVRDPEGQEISNI
ncbi:4Fe-4S binding protein [Stratiformator vulcanicus]|uniref:Electron transport protein YccM n=1 Tax=Stratiformator vulcanicus TaxID=2527980 RepID=A0A517R222_9PLAN|nr:4Fe-4S binding protein [Stratiformator vulcanicus]QDT37937.1 Putative electron transport protein YccM [Stratiformator vulcanicus]